MQVVTSAGRSEAEFRVAMSVEGALQRLRSGLSGQSRFTLVGSDTREARLSVRPNWAAWGARVTLRFVAVEESVSLVRAQWEPALATTVVTWGQGGRDLQAVAHFIEA